MEANISYFAYFCFLLGHVSSRAININSDFLQNKNAFLLIYKINATVLTETGYFVPTVITNLAIYVENL